MIEQAGESVDELTQARRISVVVAEAGTDWARWKDDWAKQGGPPVLLVQDDTESGPTFAQRVASSVARLGRQRAVLERLALIVRDDFSPAMAAARSEVLSTIALHLVRSRTPLTIRFATADDPFDDLSAIAEQA